MKKPGDKVGPPSPPYQKMLSDELKSTPEQNNREESSIKEHKGSSKRTDHINMAGNEAMEGKVNLKQRGIEGEIDIAYVLNQLPTKSDFDNLEKK